MKKFLFTICFAFSAAYAAPIPVNATVTPLKAPSGFPALAGLQYNCGGQRMQVNASGFDVSGNVLGFVDTYTICSSGGRGSHSVRHDVFNDVVWDRAGNVVAWYATHVNPAAVVGAPIYSYISNSYVGQPAVGLYQYDPVSLYWTATLSAIATDPVYGTQLVSGPYLVIVL